MCKKRSNKILPYATGFLASHASFLEPLLLSFFKIMSLICLQCVMSCSSVRLVHSRVTCTSAALMRRLFGKFDKDGSGTLDRKELQKATKMLGDRFSDEDIDVLMEILDKDHSDTVDLEEFIQAFMNKRR